MLNANRPLERKRIDLTIEALAAFAQGKPASVKLWLHHAHMDAGEREAIVSLARRRGIEPRLRLTEPGAPPLPDREPNLVCNACELGVNTAMGEGWGLVSFEHAASGGAQIVPRSSACTELWEGHAELVATRDSGVPPFSLLAMRTVDAGEVAAALERLYRDPAHLERTAALARARASAPASRWPAIVERWAALFAELLEAR